MNNLNYGYSSPNNSNFSSYSNQYSSTPSNNTRFQRPRFAYAGPPSYPRPRSSASKPNPDPYTDGTQSTGFNSLRNLDTYQNNIREYSHGYSDSMRNNFGDSTVTDSSLTVENSRESYGTPHLSSNNSSVYYTGNESFYPTPPKSLLSNYQNDTSQFGIANKGGQPPFNSNSLQQNSFYNAIAEGPTATTLDTNLRGLTGTFGTSTRGSFGLNRGNFRGRFQKRKPRGSMQQSLESTMASKWKCTICSIDFTSQIPLEMHLRGARHAKKLKTQSALNSLQGQISQVSEIDKPDGKKFFCEICNVIANSSLQLQMHLEGTKHKAKLQPKDPSKETTDDKTSPKPEVLNGKSNGGVVRPAPADFDDPKPAKMSKYSCDICNVIVNSDIQLQQHLTSKKHQAKVEGKPIIKKKKPKQDEECEQQPMEQVETSESAAKTEMTNVVGVKTLSASFVQGGTLQ